MIFFGCKNEEEKVSVQNSLFETTFRDYKNVEALSDYQKITDTVIESSEEDYRLMELQKDQKSLVVFYKVVDRDEVVVNKFSYKVVDTLQVGQLQGQERLTIGYCHKEGFDQGTIIAVIEANDSLYAKNIVRAWRANMESELIEPLRNLEGIECINEFYEG